MAPSRMQTSSDKSRELPDDLKPVSPFHVPAEIHGSWRYVMKLKSLIVVVGAAGALLASGTLVALATPGSGIAGTILANGTLAKRANIETSDIHFHSNGPTKLVTQRNDLVPGAASGWHIH